MIKRSLLAILTLVSIGNAEVTESVTWNVSDAQNAYVKDFICNDAINADDCSTNKSNLKELTGIDLNKIPFGNSDIKEIELNKISYTTDNEFPSTGKITSKVSGLLMLPNTKSPKGVILYYHPTVFDNSGVPSNLDPKNKDAFMFNTIYASIYASQGYIVVAPDYIGQGDDYSNPHPYVLYPKQSINTAIDLLNDVAGTIKEKYKLDDNEKLNLYATGYSEGASYAIWTAKCLQSSYSCYHYVNPLNSLYRLRAVAGMSGAYNISNVTLNFLEDNNDSDEYKLQSKLVTTLLKPALAANTLISYLYYGNEDNSLSIKDFNKGFFNMKCSTLPQDNCNIGYENLNLRNIFLQKHIEDEKAVGAIFSSAMYKKFPNQESASHYAIPTGNNSILDLISEKVFDNQLLLQAMHDANIDDFGSETRTPIYLFTFKEDSIVTKLNYDKFMKDANAIVDGYVFNNGKIIRNSMGGFPIKLDINKVDHLTGEIYANLFTYNYINDLNKAYL